MFLNLQQIGKINYYQKKNGLEIDFILNNSFAFEVKKTGDLININKLNKLSNQVGIDEYYLVSGNFIDNEKAIPATLI